MAAGKTKTHTFQSLAGTRKYLQPFIALFYYTSSLPSLCSVKESSIQTQTNDSLGHWSTIFLVCWFSEWSQYSLPQQLISWFIGLSCSEQCDLGLSNTLGHHFIGPLACWVCMLSHVSCVWLFVIPMDCSPPASSVSGDSPDKNTGVGCRALLQGIFPIQGSNPGLRHCRWSLYHLTHQGSPKK